MQLESPEPRDACALAMAELHMPSLGSDMEAGTLVVWRTHEGDRIARGDIIAEVETDKGVLEIEAYESGVIDALLVAAGTRVAVGAPLARLREPSAVLTKLEVPSVPSPLPKEEEEKVPIHPGRPIPGMEAPARSETHPPASCDGLERFPPSIRQRARETGEDPWTLLVSRLGPHAKPTPSRPRISPRARKRAEELGVDVADVRARGKVITSEDVERAAKGKFEPSVIEGVPKEMAIRDGVAERRTSGDEALDARARMRRAIAVSMERSNREIPHYWVKTTIDLHAAIIWLEHVNAARKVEQRMLMGALLFRATACALRRNPELNAVWESGTLRVLESIHLATAVSLRGGGLVAPAIQNADALDLDATMRALNDVVMRARAGRLRASELTSATCTVTSLGERGVENVTPRIMPPQVAMVGFGRVVMRPWAIGEAIVVRPVVEATLAGDHRVTDGHRGAAFLSALDALLQTPEAL